MFTFLACPPVELDTPHSFACSTKTEGSGRVAPAGYMLWWLWQFCFKISSPSWTKPCYKTCIWKWGSIYLLHAVFSFLCWQYLAFNNLS